MKNSTGSSYKEKRLHAEETRLALRKEWKRLWSDKYYDEKTAEGVSTREYTQLYVDQGQIIYAARGCKPLDFHEILERNLGRDYSDKVCPSPQVGGWRKFARDNLARRAPKRERPKVKVDLRQPQRKNGRGWRNQIRLYKKV
jgi:hypothetical protein